MVDLVVGNAALSDALRGAADPPQQILFELPEVVLALGDQVAKDGRGVRLAKDVGDAIGIPIDRDAARQFPPSGIEDRLAQCPLNPDGGGEGLR